MLLSILKSSYRELNHAFVEQDVYLWRMLFLTAILRISQPAEPPPNDLMAHMRLRLGNAALAIIALIFVLVTFWQH
jgi:hypothetical protein